MSSEKPMTEEIKEAVNENEHSIGEKVPGAPFAIVALSYVAILAVACFAIAAIVWMF
ncbi:MAG: hypothetical protein WBD31_20740 [Rubripirellula sp.]